MLQVIVLFRELISSITQCYFFWKVETFYLLLQGDYIKVCSHGILSVCHL